MALVHIITFFYFCPEGQIGQYDRRKYNLTNEWDKINSARPND